MQLKATIRGTAYQFETVKEVLAKREVKAWLADFGLSSDPMTIEQCARETREERERWVEYTRVAGIQPE